MVLMIMQMVADLSNLYS